MNNEATMELFLREIGRSPLETVNMLKEKLGLSLTEAKAVLVAVPSKFPGMFTGQRASELRQEFASIDAAIDAKETRPTRQKKMEISAFYETFIERYIKNITKHGAKDHSV
jgi:hypothetical protein